MKTVYERFGEKAQFQTVGYYCHACNIFYGKDQSGQDNIAQTVYGNEQDRIRKRVDPYTEISGRGGSQR